ncbi:type 2 periplasmic-binding domain-containing protein [Pseudooceanicola spongiae]|uniref:ABC transporter substrate-binding protein n=1 Tax=Pseudooceanicola spongiae TaxID=2613965 RepID=A0A7L9WTC5_9RHOB|nr:ABC transporter substrate-binding protein [Pseudooceanicola spongiae]QOL82778.1 ABC transporter substrate-binding protein [Pseudooceanicola spongiae]
MKINRRTLLAAASAVALLAQPMIAQAQNLPRNMRMVIGSKSTGGDTYQASAMVADALSEKLGINIKVDAVGSSEAFKVLERDKRGTTIMMFHDQAYLGHLYGVTGYDDIFANYNIGPTVAINPGNAYLVAADSPYQSMQDILQAAADGTRVRVAIQPGGVSEIGFSAMKNAAKVLNPGSEENIVPVNTGSQSDKNQAMWDDLADVINGSIQGNEQFTQLPADDVKAMRFVWITARPETLEQAPEAGMGGTSRDEMLKHASPATSVTLDGSKDFTFDKEFFLLYNKDMDPAVSEAIDAALTEIYADGEIQKRQKEAFFMPNFLPAAEAKAHLEDKNATYAKVIDQISAGN